MKISELSKQQCGHLAWRLNTCCGFITARRIAHGELGDLDLIEVFMKYGNRSHRSAAILTRKVVEYKPQPPFSKESEERIQIAVQQIGRILIFNSLEHCELLEVQRWFKDFVRIRSDLNKQLKE